MCLHGIVSGCVLPAARVLEISTRSIKSPGAALERYPFGQAHDLLEYAVSQDGRVRPEADQSLWNRAEPLVSDQQTYRARSQMRRSAPSDRCRVCGGQARKTGLDPSANSRSHLVFFGHRRTWLAAAGPRHAFSQVRGGCREQGATVPGANASIDRRRLHRSREPRAPAPPSRAFRRRPARGFTSRRGQPRPRWGGSGQTPMRRSATFALHQSLLLLQLL